MPLTGNAHALKLGYIFIWEIYIETQLFCTKPNSVFEGFMVAMWFDEDAIHIENDDFFAHLCLFRNSASTSFKLRPFALNKTSVW